MGIEPTKRELAWLRRLQAVVDKQPPNTWTFVNGEGGGATINLMRYGTDGKKAVDSFGGFDQDYIVGTVDTNNWDGGGW